MADDSSKRSFKSIRLTAHLHWHYLGLGFLLTLCFIAAVTMTVFIIHYQRWDLGMFMEEELAQELRAGERQMMTLFLVQVVLFVCGLIALTIVTGHRIAGPYLALKRTFKAIKDGNYSARLHFREYDKLDDVAESFNEMMDQIQQQLPESAGAEAPDRPSGGE